MLRSSKKRLRLPCLKYSTLSECPVLQSNDNWYLGYYCLRPLLLHRRRNGSSSSRRTTAAADKVNAVAMTDKMRMTDLPTRQQSVYFDVDNLEVSSSDDESFDDSPKPGGGSAPFFRSFPHRPLIHFVRNEWKKSPSYRSRSSSFHSSPSPHRGTPKWIQALSAIISAPKFRRYLTVYIILLSVFWAGWKWYLKPRIDEHVALVKALDVETQQKVGGWFGTNARPPFADIVQTRTLDPSLLPDERNGRRLVIVGDVHGCKDECMLFSFPILL